MYIQEPSRQIRETGSSAPTSGSAVSQQPGSRGNLILGVVLAATGTIVCVLLVACVALVLLILGPMGAEPDNRELQASATLSVESDGCTVVRTEVESASPVTGLQWVVTDEEGKVVLGRNAQGEYRYTYYVGGKYDVVLRAFDGSGYVDISNHVPVVCP